MYRVASSQQQLMILVFVSLRPEIMGMDNEPQTRRIDRLHDRSRKASELRTTVPAWLAMFPDGAMTLVETRTGAASIPNAGSVLTNPHSLCSFYPKFFCLEKL
jgi:hypothetical protein